MALSGGSAGSLLTPSHWLVNEAKDVQRPCYRRDVDGRLATQATAASDDSLKAVSSVAQIGKAS